MKEKFLQEISITASRINSRNSSIFWESERNIDFLHTFLKRKREVEDVKDAEMGKCIEYFGKNRGGAAWSFWYEMRKGIQESLREF
jgi:glyceraldehyde-3-phosphate dehydrogenase (ferredoxin)